MLSKACPKRLVGQSISSHGRMIYLTSKQEQFRFFSEQFRNCGAPGSQSICNIFEAYDSGYRNEASNEVQLRLSYDL